MPLHPEVTTGSENLPDVPRETCGGWACPSLLSRGSTTMQGQLGPETGEGDVLLEGDFGVPFDFGQ